MAFYAPAQAQDESATALELSDVCKWKLFPIFAGGTSKEHVNCFIYDPNTELIIVGGNTTSEDFAPAANDHGFMYAIDLEGNWQWGKFFYNVSYAVSDISGCQLNSDRSSLTIFGMGNSQPLLIDMDTTDGSIEKFMSFDHTLASDDNVPTYKTYGGLYHDMRDPTDYKEYFYLSFLMDLKIEFLKVSNEAEPEIQWVYEYALYDTSAGTILEKFNR